MDRFNVREDVLAGRLGHTPSMLGPRPEQVPYFAGKDGAPKFWRIVFAVIVEGPGDFELMEQQNAFLKTNGGA